MERSLIDLLEDEKDLVDSIHDMQQRVKSTSDYRISILMNCPDCDARTKDLARLQIEIDNTNNSISDYKMALEDVRKKLSSYIKKLLY